MTDVSFGIAFLAGLLSFMSPCVLPLVPAYVGYMGGRMTHTLALQSAHKRTTEAITTAQRANMLAHSLMFVGGFTVVFVSIGLATTALFGLLGSTAALMTDIISRLGGVVIILFGLHFMGALRWLFGQARQRPALIATPITTLLIGAVLTLLLMWGFVEPIIALPLVAGLWLWLGLGGGLQHSAAFWRNAIDQIERLLYSDTRRDLSGVASHAGISGSFLMGVVFSAGWTPCIGPIYGTILTVAANTGDVAFALPLLTAYSLGLGVPFVLAAVLMGQTQRLLRPLQRHLHRFELVTGTLLVIIGVMVASGQMTRLTQVLNNDFAELSIRIEECGLGVFQDRLAVSQLGDCLNGTLHMLALRQSSIVTLAAEGQQQFVLSLTEGQRVNVEISDYPHGFSPQIQVHRADGQLIAAKTLTPPEDGSLYVALSNLLIPSDGRYTFTITGGDGRFRFRAVLSPAASTDNAPIPTDNLLNEKAIGRAAPDFAVLTRDQRLLTLHSLRGQVVLLNFWNTWCTPCAREAQELQALHQQFLHTGLQVVAIAVRDTVEAVDAFITAHRLTFAVGLDADLTIARAYHVTGQPTTFLIGRDGVIRRVYHSAVSAQALIAPLQDALRA